MANDNVSALLALKGGSSGGGGSGTDSNAVHYSADSGKTTAERAAALANVGGEPKKLTVTFTYASSTYTADHTITEIKAAYDAGKSVEAVYNSEVYRLTYATIGIAIFACANDDGNGNPYIAALVGTSDVLTGDDNWEFHDINIAKGPVTVSVTGTTPTIALCEDNNIYECGELTSLTVTAIDNPGSFIIRFLSGATATTTTLPAGMVFPDTFTPEVNTKYEINCVDGYALAAGWPYTPPAAEE